MTAATLHQLASCALTIVRVWKSLTFGAFLPFTLRLGSLLLFMILSAVTIIIVGAPIGLDTCAAPRRQNGAAPRLTPVLARSSRPR